MLYYSLFYALAFPFANQSEMKIKGRYKKKNKIKNLIINK